ncbi:hypothetical protein GGI12_006363 [Dipsacomyces acuminosporus]|nr:hypothetical protein GGI12_006363 [Dipsacomyces acuminosporus]
MLVDLEDTLDTTASWLDTMVAKQDALAQSDDPVLTTSDMDSKAVAIERSLAKLVAKKIKKIKPQTTAAAAEGEQGETKSSNEQAAGDAQDKASKESKGTKESKENEHDEL